MQKKIHRIYFGMIILGFFLILLSGYCTLEGTENVKISVTEAAKMDQVTPEEQNYYFDVSHMSNLGLDVVFFSHHQFIRVFADGKEIYSQIDNGGIWGHTNGSIWNFVSIPFGTHELRIQFVAAYKTVQYENHEFYFGDKLDIYKAILKKSMLAMLMSILLILLGIAMIIFGTIANRKVYTGRSLQYLGVFTTIFGFWSFNETDGATLIFNHRITSAFAAFIFLMMMSSSFVLFVKEFICIEEQKIWRFICNISVVGFIICIFLQFAGIADLKETVIVTHVIMIVAILYITSVLVYKICKGQIAKTLKTNLVALIVLITASVVDMFFYYRGNMDADLFGRFIFFLFVIILGKEALGSSVKILERGKKAQIYEELATMDRLTGLYNRNAYETAITALEEKTDILIVTFDLNNLKKCNDTFGHSEGDHYIKTAANMIEKVFSPYGKSFRIGGDEFLTLIEQGKKCPIMELLEQLTFEEQKYNSEPKIKFPIYIAAGYTLYDKKTDPNIEAARDRADEFMYVNKRKSKEDI
ncbi:MAG: GGDEF domain-containing protein [Thermoflexaceae bacterium]|nr:GGDEF domain-containing protein [Thermoflexaceae bacterium]